MKRPKEVLPASLRPHYPMKLFFEEELCFLVNAAPQTVHTLGTSFSAPSLGLRPSHGSDGYDNEGLDAVLRCDDPKESGLKCGV